jgi:flagellar protein FlgJ
MVIKNLFLSILNRFSPKTSPEPKKEIPLYNFNLVNELKMLSEKEFIEIVKPIALKIAEDMKINAWVAMSQAAHESRNGNSQLARVALNLFGIKATESWASSGGAMMSFNTGEHIKGKDLMVQDAFRVYDSWAHSFLDWAKLMQKPIYKKAFEYMQKEEDGIFAIKEIARAGYATDPHYAEKVIETYLKLTGGNV